MITRTNEIKNTEVKAEEINRGANLLARLQGVSVQVKPTLAEEGYYTVKFLGIGYIEAVHFGKKAPACQLKYSYNGLEYEEVINLDAVSDAQAEVIYNQIIKHMSDIALQFDLFGTSITMDDLNKHVGKDLSIKIWIKTSTFMDKDGKQRTGHERKFGFYKPVAIPQVTEETTATEVPKF